jgi:hypothetical protein
VAKGGPVLLNFEDPNQRSFAVVVTATDGGGQSASATLSVSVTDVNEAPFWTDASLARSLDETCGPGLNGACAARSAGLSVTGGLPVLTTYSCPYPELAEQDRGICAAERIMLEELVGTDVQLSECRLDGASCCRFTASAGTQAT